jgi:hypothetical protein
MLRVYTQLKRGTTRLVGPNCPGILSPGKANVGIIPAHFFSEGNVGLVSRSGTLTYQIGNEIAQRGFGNSSIVGIGGDPIVGSSFIDIIALYEEDPETELIVMCGEIGGDEEERTADYIADNVNKPVVAYIAGFTAPPGKTMGHAGAIISGSKGTAAAKAEALEAKGVRVGKTPTEVAEIATEILSGHTAGNGRALQAPGLVHDERLQPDRGGVHARGAQRLGLARARGARPQVRRVAAHAGQPPHVRGRPVPRGAARPHAVGAQPAGERRGAPPARPAGPAVQRHGARRRGQAAAAARLPEALEGGGRRVLRRRRARLFRGRAAPDRAGPPGVRDQR